MSARRLRASAPGKVNLCLFLGGTRADGRHELVTLFQPVSLADEITLSLIGGSGDDVVVCPGVDGPNIVERALAELRSRGWDAPRVRVEIRKRIPVAAGMAGGSADAGAVLRLAVTAHSPPGFRCVVAPEVARTLGADVPSQLVPTPLLGSGAGEVVEPVRARAEHAFLILPSTERLSTPAVFAEADRLGLSRSSDSLAGCRGALEAALAAGPELPFELLINDLEPAARSLCPSIDGALDHTRSLGADVALVCGSGPTVAGIFWGADGAERAEGAAASGRERFREAVAVVPVDAGFASVRNANRHQGPAQ
ncbi:MAG: 4-(cytidine 5'-diphospho)-2-C-methyl-D-erythritol kinase [Actinomycetota bacterium]|nr:4-(cytidine 5'-diphospho)-2-C-methyl-D-erythritol kinase [Actinomycetota bacterium]